MFLTQLWTFGVKFACAPCACMWYFWVICDSKLLLFAYMSMNRPSLCNHHVTRLGPTPPLSL